MLKKVNRTAVSDIMRNVVEDTTLGLDLEAYFNLDDDKDNLVRTRALTPILKRYRILSMR